MKEPLLQVLEFTLPRERAFLHTLIRYFILIAAGGFFPFRAFFPSVSKTV